MEKSSGKSMALRRGVIVFLGLALLTVIEYILGILEAGAVFLFATALLKAGLVLWFYMHVYRLFRPDEEGHE